MNMLALFVLIIRISNETEFCRKIAAAYLAQSDHAFLGPHAAAFEHDEVIVHLAIMRETTHGSDGLFREIVLRGSVVLHYLQRNIKCSFYPIVS